VVTFLRIAIPLYPFAWSPSENRSPFFRMMFQRASSRAIGTGRSTLTRVVATSLVKRC